MSEKVLLILADGMRPDSLEACANPTVQRLMNECAASMAATTVMPSVTLPCHMSLFHSVAPERHGIVTNLYTPQVRPVKGLCEVLAEAGKRCAFFTTWEPLRDLTRPGALAQSAFYSGYSLGYRQADEQAAQSAVSCVNETAPDFVFLYFGLPDFTGHQYGWMGEEYLEAVSRCFDLINRVEGQIDSSYHMIITADHGGHDRHHGLDIKEDMLIPLLLKGPMVAKDKDIGNPSILDIAPTIAKLLDVAPCSDWEGKSIL